jgi:peptidoglycan/LPS O-acetylase OafA/YrhL
MATEHPRHFQYRPDLDGLRAFAVLGVLIFHLNPELMPGGFLAVDAFFVLSGFLMGSVVDQELKSGRFSLRRFFERRVRRLLPALIVVLLACVCAGYLTLTPQAYGDLGGSIMSASLSSSHLYFWLTSGYFDQAAELKPLLHTWSLGVEEHFYLIFPFFMRSLAPLALARKIQITACLTLCSLIACVLCTRSDPNLAFYFTLTRVWELGIGTLSVFLLQTEGAARALSRTSKGAATLIWTAALCALSLIYLLYPKTLTFPSYYPLIPCLIVLCMILFGERALEGRASLWTHPASLYLGKISYSVYLWHWPLISFSVYVLMRSLNNTERVALFALSLLLGALSFHVVERPLQRTQRFGSVLGAMGACGVIGWALHASEGLQARFRPEVKAVFEVQAEHVRLRRPCHSASVDEVRGGALCPLGAGVDLKGAALTPEPAAEPEVLLWGDSHADSARFGLHEALRRRGLRGVVFSKSACPALLGVWSRGDARSTRCQEYQRALLDYVEAHPKIKRVILVGRWALYSLGSRLGHEPGKTLYLLDDEARALPLSTAHNAAVMRRGLSRVIERLHALHKEVYLLSPTPELPIDAPQHLGMTLQYSHLFEREPYTLSVEEVRHRQREVRASFEALKGAHPALHLIDTEGALCPEGRCPIASPEGAPYYYDQHHLSALGSERLTPVFEELLRGAP